MPSIAFALLTRPFHYAHARNFAGCVILCSAPHHVDIIQCQLNTHATFTTERQTSYEIIHLFTNA